MVKPLRLVSSPPGRLRLTRGGGLAASLCLLAILLGCMSFPSEHHHHKHVHLTGPVQGAEPLEQRGTVTAGAQGSVLVYYPVPYVSNPNLTLLDGAAPLNQPSGFAGCSLTDQQPTHFRVSNPGLFPREITWVAKGVSILPKSAPASPPPQTLPDRPAPVANPTPVKEDRRAPGGTG